MKGFTLLELLIVVFLLSMVALSAASFLSEVDDQLRYEDSLARIANVREAALGRTLTVDGRPLLSGFVSDIGRLPDSLAELLRPGPLPSYAFDPATGLAAGWRGPYLDVLPELLSGQRHLRDGWGNDLLLSRAGTDLDTSLRVQSRGGSEGIYAQRFPADPQWLIQPSDYRLQADTLQLWLWNFTGADTSFASLGDSLRVELAAPVNGAVASNFATSLTIPVPETRVAPGRRLGLRMPFAQALRVPQGRCAWRASDETGTALASWRQFQVLPRTSLELDWEVR